MICDNLCIVGCLEPLAVHSTVLTPSRPDWHIVVAGGHACKSYECAHSCWGDWLKQRLVTLIKYSRNFIRWASKQKMNKVNKATTPKINGV